MKKRKRVKRSKRKRLTYVNYVLWVIIFVLIIRLSYIMIFKQNEYSAMALEQWTNEVKIDARRGKILDRNNIELAVSANVYRVDLDLNSLRAYIVKKNSTVEKVAKEIAEVLEMNEKDVEKKIELKLPSGSAAGSTTLIRRIEKLQADRVKNLKISGVIVSPDTKRYYPNNNFLAQVLGNTNSDGIGLNGVELEYNKELAGVPGVRISELDGGKKDFAYTSSRFTSPVNGKDVVLTVDEKIQYFAEKVANKGMKEHKPRSITVMVMNPNNGEILAMANKPDFDPNNPNKGFEKFDGDTEAEKIQQMWRNRAVSDAFEPGSIFKIITSAAAIEEGLAGGNETYYCSGVGSYGIKCWKPGGHGTQTFPQTLQNSCNVAFMDIGKKLGKEKLHEYIEKFGFGKKSGVDLPGESPGIAKSIDTTSDMDLATISFGQTNTVNMTQFMTAMNAVINGGTLIQPHIMKEISHEDNDGVRIIDKIFKPNKVENIISEDTSKHLNGALETVVQTGSAKETYIKGYSIAGKTGTGEKVNPKTGGYDKKEGYFSSFVGFAPSDNPQISVLIALDNPENEYFGGLVAAPLAHDLFNDIFNYIDINNYNLDKEIKNNNVMMPDIRGIKVEKAKKIIEDLNLKVTIEGSDSFVIDSDPKPGYTIKNGSKIILYTGSSSNYNKDVIVPDLEGYSKEEAKVILDKLNLKYVFEGQGTVIKQSINEGEVLKNGDTINVTLGQKIKE